LERAFALHESRRDDMGIARVVQRIAMVLAWYVGFAEAAAILHRGLAALSDGAIAERAALQAMLVPIEISTSTQMDAGVVCTPIFAGLGNPQLAAAIAADAASHQVQAREHFEIALCQANDLPHRLLKPSVQYWYGRTLSRHSDTTERSRGRAMLKAALADFQSLEMVLHAKLAEAQLRDNSH
jgi:hypothetical protein